MKTVAGIVSRFTRETGIAHISTVERDHRSRQEAAINLPESPVITHNNVLIRRIIQQMSNKNRMTFTFGCRAMIAKAKARMKFVTRKKMLRPQSFPEGLNQMNRIPVNVNAPR